MRCEGCKTYHTADLYHDPRAGFARVGKMGTKCLCYQCRRDALEDLISDAQLDIRKWEKELQELARGS